jgi:hypothetical protein
MQGRSPHPPDPEVVRVTPPGGRRPRVLAAGAIAIILALVAWGLADPGPTIAPPRDGAPDTADSTDAPASPTARRGLLVVRGTGPGLALVEAHLGWDPCPTWSGYGWAMRVDPAAVDAALGPRAGPVPREEDAAPRDAAPRDAAPPGPVLRGVLHLTDRSGRPALVWVGPSLDEAVRGLGGRMLFEGSDDTSWTVLPGAPGEPLVGARVAAHTSPAGRTFWRVVDRAGRMPYCVPEEPASADEPDALAVAGVEVLERRREGSQLIAIRQGWTSCAVWTQYRRSHDRPTGWAIDAAADVTGRDLGWVDVPRRDRDLRIRIGADPALMGAAHGARTVAVNPLAGVAWILVTVDGREVAQQIMRVHTPGGRVAWLPTENASGPTDDCGDPSDR